jgi:hypothetical protein
MKKMDEKQFSDVVMVAIYSGYFRRARGTYSRMQE